MTSRSMIALSAALLLAACAADEPAGEPELAAAAQAEAALDTPAARLARARQADKLFVSWCSGCHGERGRGDGPAARAIDPKPRNLVREKFKIRSTASGKPPAARDVYETLGRGLPGTSMPSFAFLPEQDRWLLVEHVRALAGHDQQPEPVPMPVGAAPASSAEQIARGKDVYMNLGCNRCHGDGGRGDGPASRELKDEQGRPVPARDYSKGLYLGGDRPEDIYKRLVTGLDGSGMPSYAESMSAADGWAVAHYVLSLRVPEPAPPADPIERGRAVVAARQCTACHVLEGKGGAVGPSLDVAARKLRFDWVKGWLRDPPAHGKLYPHLPYRMPNLGLSDEEIDGVLAYLASTAGRAYPEPEPAAPAIDQELAAKGQLIYFLKCTECHNMGDVVRTPEAKRQGPDLIEVSRRIKWEWLPTWVNNPQQVYPGTSMIDTNLTPEEIEAVAAFVWQTSAAARPR